MYMRLAICGLALFLAACPKDTATPEDRTSQQGTVAPGDSLVYADRGARQCESDGMSLEASAQLLIDGGMDVVNSTCGIRTGVDYPDVCGGGTVDILVHQIRTVNLSDAEPLGFQEINTLVNAAAGTGYELINCDDRFPIG